MAQPRTPARLTLTDPQVGLLVVVLALESGWSHRRVEKREFLDETTLRVRLSFDVTIPDVAPLIGPADARLVPLTFLEKRDLTDLNFTDDTGRTIPMLTSPQSGKLAADGLIELANSLRPRVGRMTPPLDNKVRDELTTIASADLAAAEEVVNKLDRLLTQGLPPRPTLTDRQRHALWSDEAFREVARKFAYSYLVCARTHSLVGERRIFHLNYLRDYTFIQLPFWKEKQATLGLHPRRFEVPLDDRVSASSYHAEVQTPGDIHVVALEVVEVVAPPSPMPPAGLQEVERVLVSETGRTNRLHIRVPDPQAITARKVRCEVQVRQRGWLRNSALMAGAALLLLVGAFVFLGRLAHPVAKESKIVTTCNGRVVSVKPTARPVPKPVKPTPTQAATPAPELPAGITLTCARLDDPAPNDQSGLAATVLLALLGVAATVLTRPGDNPLASKLLGGARFATVTVAVVLFSASASLAVAHESTGLHVLWGAFIVMTGTCAGLLNYLAWRRR